MLQDLNDVAQMSTAIGLLFAEMVLDVHEVVFLGIVAALVMSMENLKANM